MTSSQADPSDVPVEAAGEAPVEAGPVEVGQFLCPYCGHVGTDADRCGACKGLFEPLSRQATQNAMGPWQIRDVEAPHTPGCSLETLRQLIRRGRVTKDTILRGPTTRQFWNFARNAPGVAVLLGECHACHREVSTEAFMCPDCHATLNPTTDRQTLGLAPVKLLPGAASAAAVAASSLQGHAPARARESVGAGQRAALGGAPRRMTPPPPPEGEARLERPMAREGEADVRGQRENARLRKRLAALSWALTAVIAINVLTVGAVAVVIAINGGVGILGRPAPTSTNGSAAPRVPAPAPAGDASVGRESGETDASDDSVARENAAAPRGERGRRGPSSLTLIEPGPVVDSAEAEAGVEVVEEPVAEPTEPPAPPQVDPLAAWRDRINEAEQLIELSSLESLRHAQRILTEVLGEVTGHTDLVRVETEAPELVGMLRALAERIERLEAREAF